MGQIWWLFAWITTKVPIKFVISWRKTNCRISGWLGRRSALQFFLETAEDEAPRYPVVVDTKGQVHAGIGVVELATITGLRCDVSGKIFDVAVVGAGPGGLAATVYAASEGLDVVTIDRLGQVARPVPVVKLRITLVFQQVFLDQILAAAALTQANKFGATVSVAHTAHGIDCDRGDGIYRIQVDEGVVQTRSIVIATGARYRHLQFEGARAFDGSGVYYGATAMEGQLCGGQDVLLVGGGNSAGQAAVFLGMHAKRAYSHSPYWP